MVRTKAAAVAAARTPGAMEAVFHRNLLTIFFLSTKRTGTEPEDTNKWNHRKLCHVSSGSEDC